jgi:predicted membrane chloride channel (bestrophin family)
MSSEGFAGATTAIAILAGFRLNASYGRYEECRIFWGDTNNTIRDLAGETMMYMKDEDQRARMLKLCKAYPVALMFHLNGKGCHHSMKRKTPVSPPFADRLHAEFQAELRDIYSDGKDEADFVRLSDVKYKGANTPLEVLTCMRETIAASIGTVDAILVRSMDEQCQRLCGAFGASERVLRTPLPTGFTRHSSRLLALWSSTLPLALYPAMGPWLTIPTALLTAYAVLGIEDIGVQLEEPFDVLPLRQYSDGMFDSINQVERNYKQYQIQQGEPARMVD